MRQDGWVDRTHDLVDTTWFSTLEEALSDLDPGQTYDNLARHYFSGSIPIDPPVEQLVVQSLLVRMAGLHRGIWQGLADDNPYAVWPLMRAYFELEVTMAYLTRHPELVMALAERPSSTNPDALILPGISKMVSAVVDLIPSGQAAYRELSDITHIGVLATWSAHRVTGTDEGLDLHWSSRPMFRPEQVPTAAAQLKQLVEGTQYVFGILVQRVLGG